MDKKLLVSPSPHIHSGDNTQRLMRDVLIALALPLVMTLVVYGMRPLMVTTVAVASCIAFEYLIQKYLLKGKNTICDLSAVLTGVLLAFNLPSSIPLWMVVIGSLVAIGIGKMSFGGLGRNPFNPALVGRVFLLISFPVAMTSFPPVADAATGATPLALAKGMLKAGQSVTDVMSQVSYNDMFMGIKAGSLGEITAWALLLGGLYLIIRKVITWHIPVAVLGSMAVFSGILWAVDQQAYMSPLFHILTGGAILGAVYMATDYVTSPMTPRGMLIFGVGIGVITMLIRTWGAYPEGISFAILIMNSVVPLINKYVKPRRFAVAISK